MTLRKMLDTLCRREGSERRVAALLGMSQTSFNNWMRGRAFPSDDQARKVAELLKLDDAYVLAVVHAERAKTKETRAAWERIAATFAKAAALAVFTATPFLLPAPPAQAAGFDINEANTHWRRKQRRGWLDGIGGGR